MAEVYILYSMKLDRYYIGSFADFSERFRQHLQKEMENSFTSKADDWVLYYKVDGLDAKQARAIETHIKAMKSKMFIANLKKYPEIMDKLRISFLLINAGAVLVLTAKFFVSVSMPCVV